MPRFGTCLPWSHSEKTRYGSVHVVIAPRSSRYLVSESRKPTRDPTQRIQGSVVQHSDHGTDDPTHDARTLLYPTGGQHSGFVAVSSTLGDTHRTHSSTCPHFKHFCTVCLPEAIWFQVCSLLCRRMSQESLGQRNLSGLIVEVLSFMFAREVIVRVASL